MKAVIPAIIALAAAPAAAEDAMVIIRFDPVDNHVTIDFPTTQSNQLDGATPPDWLTLASDTQHPVLTGTLPALARDARGLGASATGAYLFDPLAWLPEPFASAHQSVRIETPVPFRGVVAGDLLSETHSDGLYTATFRVDRSLAEADVFFGPYEISENLLELPGGTVRLRTYFLAKDQAYAEAYLDASARYITRYSQDVGHYPNAGFAVVSAPIPVGYAYDGLTYISEAILAHPYMLGRSLAHEILHNWWGSGVRVDYSAGNWAEGLTTYLADHALAEDHDPAAATEMRYNWLTTLSNLPVGQDKPLRRFRSAGHDGDQSVGYGKAAMLFHDLRQRLGAEAFDNAIRQFWHLHRDKRAGWDDLQAVFSAAASKDLSRYFGQWLDREGLPRICLEDVELERRENEFAVTFSLSQTSPPYSLRVPVLIETEQGPSEVTLHIKEAQRTATIEVPARPIKLEIAPYHHMLRALSKDELPLTFLDFIRSGNAVLFANAQQETAVGSVANDVLASTDDIPMVDIASGLPRDASVLFFGTPEEMERGRGTLPDDPTAEAIQDGAVRAWVEADRAGRIWLFAVAEDVERIAPTLRTLRYYRGQSFLISTEQDRPSSGRWPVTKGPLTFSWRDDPE